MLERLTQEEQQALMQLMACLARADGRLRDIERELLAQYADLFHIQMADVMCDCDADSLDMLVAQFQRPKSRVVVLQELLRLAHLDGIFNKDEKSLILKVAELMSVPPEFVKEIDDWVLAGIEWTIHGERLLDKASEMLDVSSE